MIDRHGIEWQPTGRYREAVMYFAGDLGTGSLADACRVAGINEVVTYLNGEFNKLIQAFYGVEQ